MRMLPFALGAPLSLAACDAQQAATAEGGGAAGEVLEGSISDDMLPIEQLRSQPPQAEIVPEEVETGSAAADDAASGEAEEPATAETPEPAAAEEPAVSE